MSHYELSILLTVVITGLLSAFSLIKGERILIIRQFSLYTLLIGFWAILWYNMITAITYPEALFWARALHLPAAFIPSSFLHFTQQLVGKDQKKAQIILRRVLYVISLFFVLICFHPNFVKTVTIHEGLGYYLEAGPLYYYYLPFFMFSVVATFSMLIRALFQESGIKRLQLAYALSGYAIAYSMGMTVFLPVFNYSVPRYAIYGIPIAHLILFYAIVRHRLLNVRVLIRRATLLIGIYSVLVLSLLPLIFFVHKHLSGSQIVSPINVVTILIVGLVLSIGPFLYAYFVKRNAYFHETTLAGLTHELKSPLAAIESALELINSNIGSEKSSIYFEMIGKNSERLRKSIEDLLLVFKNQGLDLILQKREVNLCKLIEKCCWSYQFLASSRNVEIRFPIKKSIKINCDPKGIEQVISNILSNGIKFSRESCIDIECNIKQSEAIVTVQDFGNGISGEELPYIFDRFFQGKNDFNEKGSGIGLTIAKAWIEAHRGKIWAESDGEGKGTKVTFTLPL